MFLMLLGELCVGRWKISRGLDFVRILKKCFYFRGVGSGSENGSEGDGSEERWRGKYNRDIVVLSSSEGIAIGDRP